MRRCLQIAAIVTGIYIVANLAYFVKSANGIDILPGHHGNLLPLGDWLWRLSRTARA